MSSGRRPCRKCQRLMPIDDLYCRHCGAGQRAKWQRFARRAVKGGVVGGVGASIREGLKIGINCATRGGAGCTVRGILGTVIGGGLIGAVAGAAAGFVADVIFTDD